MWIAPLVIGLAAVAGCGGGSSDAVSGPTRVVVDAEGTEVAVPEAPERVVTLSEPTLDGALALGVVPVGTVSGRGQAAVPSYLADRAADVPVIGSIGQPNFEAIGATAPDLILVDGTGINNNAAAIEALRHIAPTVVTGFAGGDWRSNFALVAEALGRTEGGDEVVEEYETLVDRVSGELDAFADDTFSIVRWQGGAPALILTELPPGRALTDLGLARPAGQDRRGRGHSEPVSLENLAEIDADYMFFGTLGGSSVNNPQAGGGTDVAASQAALADALEAPGFTRLTAYELSL
ncbi:UNVERIFIED_CONTAM: iron siderophore ABC transporter substrate-binding protein, partial [Mumia flava]